MENLNDKEIISKIIEKEKDASLLALHAAQVGSKNLRNDFLNIAVEEAQTAGNFYEEMLSRGWTNENDAIAEEINKVYQKYCHNTETDKSESRII